MTKMTSTPQIVVSNFAHTLLDKTVHFKVIHLDQSIFVWVGINPTLSNMAVAMPANDNSIPASTNLFGNKSHLENSSLAQKLAKRLSKQVFISCSVPFDQQMSPLIEKALAHSLNQ